MSTNSTTGTTGNEDTRDTPWSHDSAVVGKLNATQSIGCSTKRCERKRKQQVPTAPKDAKYQRNSSKKINRRCDAGVRDSRRKRRREVGVSVWAGKRTHPTSITHAILNATPRGTGSVQQQTSFQCEQLLKGRNGFESRCDFLPTHNQISALVAKSLPSRAASVFTSEFTKLVTAKTAFSTGEGFGRRSLSLEEYQASPGYLCKTPMSAVAEALTATFGQGCVSVRRPHKVEELRGACTEHEHCNCSLTKQDGFEVFLMDVILNREVVNKVAKQHTKQPACRNNTDNPILVAAATSAGVSDLVDDNYRTAIAYVPDAGIFYCARERRTKREGIVGSHIPLDASWLRLLRHGPEWFAKGGYAKRLFYTGSNELQRGAACASIFRLCITYPNGCLVRTMQMLQCPDIHGPRLVPDVVPHLPVDQLKAPPLHGDKDRRRDYLDAFQKSPSRKKGCRQYVKGFLHKTIPDTALIIDALPGMGYDLRIGVQRHVLEECATTRNRHHPISIVRESIVKVRYMGTHQPHTTVSLDHLVGNGLQLTCNGKSAGVRSGMGDKGKMFAVGSHANLKKRNIVAFKDNRAVGTCYLGNAVKAMATLGEMVFPHVLRVVQDLERDTKLDALPCMEKVESSRTPGGPSHLHRVGLSLDVSDKLSNASHYDVNDGSVGFAVWTESNPGSTRNWYFVLPNVFGSSVRRVGESALPFNGVAIKLTHGMAICWDGRLIRHCTSVMSFDHPKGQHAFGTFCSAKTRNILCGLSMIRDEELAHAGSLVQPGVNDTTGAGGAVVRQQTLTTSGGHAPVIQRLSSDVVQQRTGAIVVGGWLDDEEDTGDEVEDKDGDEDKDEYDSQH